MTDTTTFAASAKSVADPSKPERETERRLRDRSSREEGPVRGGRRRGSAGSAARGLASARDRRRLRDRQRGERGRVEAALASAPMPSVDDELSEPRFDEALAAIVPLQRMRRTELGSEASGYAAVACPVCAGTDIRFDEVFRSGRMRLSSCQRCDHFWTGH